jgi:hypothetical protein
MEHWDKKESQSLVKMNGFSAYVTRRHFASQTVGRDATLGLSGTAAGS